MTAKILIVEDDAQLGRATAIRLHAAGYEVQVARDAYQALQFARQEPPDLVILDLGMPAGDGFHVHESLLKFNNFYAPVIYMTGTGKARDEAHAKKLGAAAFLHKPVEPDLLVEEVRRCLQLSA